MLLTIMKLFSFCSCATLLVANRQDHFVDAGLVRTNVLTKRASLFHSNKMIGTVSASNLVQKQRKTILHMTSESSDSNILTTVAKTTPMASSSLMTTITAMIKQTLPAGNVADDMNQLTPYMAALIVVSGLAVGQFVASIRKLLPVVNTWFNRAPAFGPIAGSVVVAALYWYCKDLGKGMETIYAPLSKDDLSSLKDKNVDVNSTFSIRRQALRLIATIATLSSGCAMAFTGPAAEIGMTIGRSIGLKTLKSESARRRLVLACAGAGMTANFDTPLTAVFFASEISQAFIKDTTVNMDVKTTAASKRMDTIALLLACAASSFVCRGFGYLSAGHPALNSFSFTLSHNPFELGVFALLGAMGALLNVYFERGRKAAVKTLSKIPQGFRPLVGGAVCTLAGLAGYHQSVFKGFAAVKGIVMGDKGLTDPFNLISFIVSKGCFVAIAGASGLFGGPFAHAQFMGTALGVLTGLTFAPILTYDNMCCRGTYAALGLSSVVAAMFRSPLVALLLVLEFTKQFDLLVPLLITTGTATLVSYKLM